MDVGGYDIVLAAPPDSPVAEVILRLIGQRWPGAFFLDAEQEAAEPIHSPRVLMRGGRSPEFFVFRDRAAADSWLEDGATPGNVDTMLHFLIADHRRADRSPRRVTMVCDGPSPAMSRLAADLVASFRGSRRVVLPRPAA